jgi:hypothetical protein
MSPETRKDLLGKPLTAVEKRLLAAYDSLEALLALDLPPTAAANVREAVAALWQAVHNLLITDERPDV